MAAEFRLRSQEEIDRLTTENAAQRKSAVRKLAALKEEIRQLSEARLGMTVPFGLPAKPSTVSARHPQEVGAILVEAVPENPFDPASFTQYVDFIADSTLSGIAYSDPHDIHELYRSFNRVQAAPDGGRMQPCDAFVCLTGCENAVNVFAVWWMAASEEVLVCRPNLPAGSAKEAGALIREAIGYFERIGFMIDPVDLETDAAKRIRQIEEQPIFRRIPLEHAA